MDQGDLVHGSEEKMLELPPGFRFHPTDEELITHYLNNKVLDASFNARAIGEVDLNKCEPWDLPWRAKMGEKEWYFFCLKDRKYPTGLRTNRATEAGYWKATGKDKEIYRGKSLVGMKKTLVFYGGRAPKGEKTNWVMHEYRVEGKYSLYTQTKSAKNEWVISRVFKKSSSGAKKATDCAARLGSSFGDEMSSLLPPLMEVSCQDNNKNTAASGPASHVSCFSNIAVEDQKGHGHQSNYNLQMPVAAADSLYARNSNRGDHRAAGTQAGNNSMQLLYDSSDSLVQLLQSNAYGNGNGMKQSRKAEREMLSNISQETGLTTDLNPEISSVLSNINDIGGHTSFEAPSSSSAGGPLQLDQCLWSY